MELSLIKKEKGVFIHQTADGVMYYSMKKTDDKFIIKVPNADEAFNYCSRKNNGKLKNVHSL